MAGMRPHADRQRSYPHSLKPFLVPDTFETDSSRLATVMRKD